MSSSVQVVVEAVRVDHDDVRARHLVLHLLDVLSLPVCHRAALEGLVERSLIRRRLVLKLYFVGLNDLPNHEASVAKDGTLQFRAALESEEGSRGSALHVFSFFACDIDQALRVEVRLDLVLRDSRAGELSGERGRINAEFCVPTDSIGDHEARVGAFGRVLPSCRHQFIFRDNYRF
eukprot:CAMPEP_0185569928 /NCGR_PEP_ID=MMETSP0434-20130131/2410_1 /TAXON_ID=626734 ORGANISM="Favella taraikaensis, Strain Fe Narragansett Bay" /NCGR_SAMPLE_ID=MMETSP0434 /ASSEMBLY_ACC=CAM_ASM_000379 /LENGTH=176 /DNA_ID=CAMNT_0028184901 /DNA_START=637 /DNA_END=1163 /DNA_ORIENTATION=+